MNITFQKQEYSKKIWKKALLDPIKYGCRQLVKDYIFCINGDIFTIRSGFWWNGASIPKFAKSLVGGSWDDDIYFGALIHDMLYGTQVYNRSTCDIVMDIVNMQSGMSKTKRWLVLKALWLCGSKAYYASDKSINGISKFLKINGIQYKTGFESCRE